MKRLFALAAALSVCACAAPPAARIAPEVLDTPARVDWKAEILEHIPPLSCARAARRPMILWHAPAFETAQDVRALLARGIVPNIRVNAAPETVAAAKIIQSAGAPVMMMEGQSGAWGYNGGGGGGGGASGAAEKPSPMDIAGWRAAGEKIRSIMRAHRDAGVTVDALWLDYEVDPLNLRYDDVLRAPEAHANIPPGALKSAAAFAVWRRQLWTGLMSAYTAGPAREIFPAISAANWMTVLSTPENPAPGMIAGAVPPAGAGLFTATNPAAYGTDAGFWAQGGAADMDQDEADRIYTALVLGQFSADAANRRAAAPHLESAPWAGRWVVISQQPESSAGGLGVQVAEHEKGLLIKSADPAGPGAAAGLREGDIITRADGKTLAGLKLAAAVGIVRGRPGSALRLGALRGNEAFAAEITRARLDGGRPPVMSRERYREALRHIWLRGADAMQVFNSATPGHADLAFAEAEDAQKIYAEMLAHRKFLERGAPINLNTPRPADRIVWSGLRLGDEAVVRISGIGALRGEITINPWAGAPGAAGVTLPVTDAGAGAGAGAGGGEGAGEGVTWRLRRNPQTGRITAEPAPAGC